jgi:hypothetical protein
MTSAMLRAAIHLLLDFGELCEEEVAGLEDRVSDCPLELRSWRSNLPECVALAFAGRLSDAEDFQCIGYALIWMIVEG